jgi:hypothetical protein
MLMTIKSWIISNLKKKHGYPSLLKVKYAYLRPFPDMISQCENNQKKKKATTL